jgi:hypothetical protein
VPAALGDIISSRRQQIEDAIRAEVQKDSSGAEVLLDLSPGDEGPLLASLGIWTSPGDATAAMLKAGLRALDLLSDAPGATRAGVFLRAGYIKQAAADSFETAAKRYNHDGEADPEGSTHLTGIDVSFVAPQFVITRLTGFDDSTWPDVPLKITITDKLSVPADGEGRIECGTDAKVDVDSSFLFLSGALSTLLGNIVFAAAFVLQGILAELSEGPLDREEGGAGCAAAGDIPTSVPFPITNGLGKLVFDYDAGSGVRVTSGGIFALGRWSLGVRDPAVFIAGPSAVTIPSLGKARRRYRIDPVDLRADFEILWSNGDTTPQTTVEFRGGGLPDGAKFTQPIAVNVTDADGLTAAAEKQIVVQIKGPVHPP